MGDFKKPEIFNTELDKFTKALIKKFPEIPDAITLTKVCKRRMLPARADECAPHARAVAWSARVCSRQTPGQELFQKRATEFATVLRDFYLTFLDLINFTDEAWKALTDISKNFTEFTVRHALAVNAACRTSQRIES